MNDTAARTTRSTPRRSTSRVISAAILMCTVAGCGDSSSSSTADSNDSSTTTSASSTSTTRSTTTGTTPTLTGHLLYSRFDESTHTFLSTHVAAADGSHETNLPLPGPEGGGRWSHAGTDIASMAIQPDQRLTTAIITADGTVERTLAIADPALNLVCTVWSPDDARLACEGWDDNDATRNGLYLVDAADGGHLQRVTTTPDGLGDLPGDFTPDGKSLLFKRASGEDAGQLLLADTKAPGEPRSFATGEFEDAGRFSPDGTLVATSHNGQVLVLGADGTVRDTIDVTSHYLFGPSWSPDGQWIVYSSALNGVDADLYASHSDGTAAFQITHTPDNEIDVDWGRS